MDETTSNSFLYPLSRMPIQFGGNGSRYRGRVHCQRAAMRAVARTVLAERGYAGVHVRDLAQRCGVSAQTLYNNLGGREEILQSATDELLRAQLAYTSATTQHSGSNFLLAFCDLSSQLLEFDREYVQAIIAIVTDRQSRPTLAERINQRCVDTYCRQLQSMQQAGTLKQWVAVDTLAATLQKTIRNVLLEHATNAADPKRLRDDLTMNVGLLLLGVTRRDEGARIEAAIRAAQHS